MKVSRRLVAVLLAALMGVGPICSAAALDVVVDGGERHQTIDGFGTCLIAWTGRMQALYRKESYPDFYVNTMGMNMLRVNMWGPVMPDAKEDWRDIRWQDFDKGANGGRAAIFVEFGKRIRALNPEAKLIGTVWSPPAWMKENGSIEGERSASINADSYDYRREGRAFPNHVKKQYYKHFAKWMAEYVKWHAAEGAPLYAVSIGNEVMFTQEFESCVWNGPDYVEMVKVLGKTLEEEGLGDLKIFGPETLTSHNWSVANPMYVRLLMEDEAARNYLDVFATHGYVDGFTEDMSRNSSAEFYSLIRDSGKPYWMTEGGTGGHDWPQPLGGAAAAIHNAFVAGNASAFVPWQISEGRPITNNLTVMDTLTKKANAVQHFSRFIHDGAVRIGATPAFGDVKVSAYVHDGDKEVTIVLINPTGESQEVSLTLRGLEVADSELAAVRTSATEAFESTAGAAVSDGKVTVTLPAESMVTLSGVLR